MVDIDNFTDQFSMEYRHESACASQTGPGRSRKPSLILENLPQIRTFCSGLAWSDSVAVISIRSGDSIHSSRILAFWATKYRLRFASLARAWCDVEERRRILMGKPLPGVLKPEAKPRKQRQSSTPSPIRRPQVVAFEQPQTPQDNSACGV